MAGDSKRFKDAGYTLPKYRLPLKKINIFSEVLKPWLEKTNEKLLLIFKKPDDSDWIENQKIFKKYKERFELFKLQNSTRGQAETVFIALEKLNYNENIFIFNIDTIYLDPPINLYKLKHDFDCLIDVSFFTGDQWSFVEIDKSYISNIYKKVNKIIEKKRISKWASNGLYFFKNTKIYKKAFSNVEKNTKYLYNNEIYISSLIQYLIEKNFKVGCVESLSNIINLGTPEDYLFSTENNSL